MTKDQIVQKVAEMKSKGVELRGKTLEALNQLENPHYSITLTGCFQVGKSTLLNRVMLGSDILLAEGKGLATTAIPTKIVYGEQKELRIVYRDSSIPEQIYAESEITDDLLRSLTTASGEQNRLELARKIRYIQLSLPVEFIRNYKFFDTPGVDDPNQELIDQTTAETLPESDLIVLVVDAGTTLSAESKKFLQKSIFQQGMSRVLILASYKPQNYKTAAERQLILETIRADLAGIGREYIPVYSYTYDSPENVDGDILHGPKEIMDCLLRFIDENKDQAKIDKLTYFLQNDVRCFLENLKAKLEVNGKSEIEIKALEKKINEAAISLDAEYTHLTNQVNNDFISITQNSRERLEAQLYNGANSLNAEFMNEIGECNDLASVRGKIDSIVSKYTPKVQQIMSAEGTEVQKQIEKLLLNYSDFMAKAASKISLSTEFVPVVNTGWAGKINPIFLKIIGIGGALYFGGLIPAIGVFLAEKIPGLKNLLPTEFARRMVLSSVERSFRSSLESAVLDFIQQINKSIDSVKDGIRLAFEDIYAERIAPYNTAIKENMDSMMTEEEIASVRQTIEAMSDELKKLNA